MSATSMLHVRVDPRLKAKAEKALDAMGLSISDLVRITLTRVAAEKRVPFELRVPNAKTRAAIAEGRRGEVKRFAKVRDLLADADADD